MNFWRPASSADYVWFPRTIGLWGLEVQVVGLEQNLEHPRTSMHGHGDAGCQEGTLNLKAQTSPTTAVFKAMDLVSLRWYLEGKMSSRAHKELE